MSMSSSDDELDDRDVMEATVDEIVTQVAATIDGGWSLSPQGTLLALSRVLGFLALQYVEQHPQARSRILAMLRTVVDAVEVESGPRH
jgi:hypothetical protein